MIANPHAHTRRAFFARLVLTGRGRSLSPAGRELAREHYLRAVEADLAAAERRTRTLAGMAAVVPPDAYHHHTGSARVLPWRR